MQVQATVNLDTETAVQTPTNYNPLEKLNEIAANPGDVNKINGFKRAMKGPHGDAYLQVIRDKWNQMSSSEEQFVNDILSRIGVNRFGTPGQTIQNLS